MGAGGDLADDHDTQCEGGGEHQAHGGIRLDAGMPFNGTDTQRGKCTGDKGTDEKRPAQQVGDGDTGQYGMRDGVTQQ